MQIKLFVFFFFLFFWRFLDVQPEMSFIPTPNFVSEILPHKENNSLENLGHSSPDSAKLFEFNIMHQFFNQNPNNQMKSNMKYNVGILIFDNAEVLDFAGPFEVFSVTSELNNHELFDVFTISKDGSPVTAVNGLSVNPMYSFQNVSKDINILILSGGAGTRQVIQDPETLDWISKVHKNTQITASICSGSRMLGVLGLLDNMEYVTHHEVFAHMQEIAPKAIPNKNKRFIDNGRIMTSGGISAGIDLSFHIVEKLLGTAIKEKTATYMEYRLYEE